MGERRANPPIIDTHAHLDELADLERAVAEAKAAGVAGIIAVGVGYASNLKSLDIAAKFPGFVHPALGLYPWEIANEMPALNRSLSTIEDNIRLAVAVGEVGLDYDKRVRSQTEKDKQQSVLRDLLSIAKKHDKPVSFHSRYAWKDSLEIVLESGVKKVVFHWFTGFSSTLQGLLNAGFLVSATPAAEYHEEHRRAIGEMPLSKIMLETDCPVQYGRENRFTSHPLDLVRSLDAVAQIKGADRETVAQETTSNAVSFFGLPDLP